jgi:hypothetical protein
MQIKPGETATALCSRCGIVWAITVGKGPFSKRVRQEGATVPSVCPRCQRPLKSSDEERTQQ